MELDVILEEMDEEIAVMQNELISERDYEKLMNQFENRFVNSNSSVGVQVHLRLTICYTAMLI